ncbi:ENTH domain containing protein [Pyrenophora tritici-repentis]|uniref:ENTH domain containing protein n=2 Tax=Pyrenophora tritici-repentis TaxID=45151 RepID=A0A2W1FKS4_9PLEO|nr:ENTH domain containing protein [Pyrenophora tritici-repentis Pt-1C-BFP]KAA8614692.1 ENTH domain-containing protein [Pyrenophora tritici-repentis]EDU50049.1 ENTH domain containing protein [Pyrenophora tritici-repentis Pt-1C-BFP]KAF7444521.1 ENTH domain containing protein [Pyrenophora tritici-repentis]KAF7564823.1 ENTH domain containing protein [Pyrenophora tritici-repentis]KAG9378761.1 ENTH domain containing protein [Pyrenophora tritici-repentis]
MASSFEKSVKGGTKIKLAAPKSKYVEHILVATHAGEAGVAEIFRALTNRLRDSTWTIVYKSLIIVHLMIREGEPDVTLKFLAQNPHRKLAINHFTEVQTQGHNIRTYSEYLLRRAIEYGATKVDYVRGGEGRLKRLSVEKGLLREAESVQDQIRALLKCQPFDDEPENEITMTAFRLLTMDLLVLFHVMNEGTINILEHYFELSRPDATRALAVYRTFVKQTEAVVQYLSLARSHEHSTRLEIPKIKHAPTSLAASLEEYLNDKDFEINRRQYMAEKEAKKNGGKTTNGASKPLDPKPAASHNASSQPPAAPAKPSASAPLIDLFESLEDNQQTMATQPMMQQQYPQQTGFQQGFQMPQQTANMGFPQQSQPFPMQNGQNTNPFQMQQQAQAPQLQAQFTGAGFGGYTPQPFNSQGTMPSIPQNGMPDFSQQQQHMQIPTIAEPLQPQQTSTNPFRQSMLPNATGMGDTKMLTSPTGTSSINRTSTNPFAKQNTGFSQQSQSPVNSPSFSISPIQESPFAPMQQQPLQPTPTGTNPFARQPSPQSATSPQGGLTVHATGSTNPFRQSAFVNQQTGQGWQNTSNQGTMGGMSLDQVPTTSVFPRPGQQQQNFLG